MQIGYSLYAYRYQFMKRKIDEILYVNSSLVSSSRKLNWLMNMEHFKVSLSKKIKEHEHDYTNSFIKSTVCVSIVFALERVMSTQ